ncbi:MAG: flagellar basal body protein, partial [Hyphomonas sp.]|nr:flagellar basal body protein [Hyphomonas sp.]
MSLSSAINAARSGLQVSSLRAEIVATNVANATTPGYV